MQMPISYCPDAPVLTWFLLRKRWMGSLETDCSMWILEQIRYFSPLAQVGIQPHLKNLFQTVLWGHREREHAEVSDEAGGHGVAATTWRCARWYNRYVLYGEKSTWVTQQRRTCNVPIPTVGLNQQFWRTYPRTALCYIFQHIIWLNSHNHLRRSLLLSPLCRWKNQGPGWLNKLLKVTQLTHLSCINTPM